MFVFLLSVMDPQLPYALLLYLSSLCLRALVTRALTPPEVEGTKERDLCKQSWESIVPPTDRIFRALQLFPWRQAWRRSGLSVRGCFWWKET